MTLTNLIKAAKADAQDARELQARVEALLANSKPQKFAPPPEPEPEPGPKCLEETEEPEQPTAVVKVVYHHDRRCSTGELLEMAFAGPMAGR